MKQCSGAEKELFSEIPCFYYRLKMRLVRDQPKQRDASKTVYVAQWYRNGLAAFNTQRKHRYIRPH